MPHTLNRAQRLIVNHMPPHNLFLEIYLENKPIMCMKRRAQINIGVDPNEQAAARAAAQCSEPGTVIRCAHPIEFLRKNEWLHSQGGELVLCKPPTYDGTLLETLRDLPCMVMLSGPWSSLCESILTDWRTVSYKGAGGVDYFLWMNYPPPFELHDYRFIGNNAHERDQLKRMVDRWQQRLNEMPTLKRYALLSALSERNKKNKPS